MRADADRPVLAVHAGTVSYALAWRWQRELVGLRAGDAVPDLLLTLEHPKVYTAGKRAHAEHVLWAEDERRARGIELYEVDRGGDVTYHGPGQLVAYPILRLAAIRGVVDYVRALERVCVAVAARFGVHATTDPDYTGVWVDRRKLAAIGVRVSSHGVTSHGLALNVTTELGDFAGIVPCGIPDRDVCSLESLGVAATLAKVRDALRDEFAAEFGCTLEAARVDDLPLTTAATA